MTSQQANLLAWEIVTGKRKRLTLKFRTKGEAKTWMRFFAHAFERFTRPVVERETGPCVWCGSDTVDGLCGVSCWRSRAVRSKRAALAALPVFCPPGIPLDCPVLPRLREHVDGDCDNCGAKLTGRRRRWCSDKCGSARYAEFSREHDWNAARHAALKRDGHKCVKCGSTSYPLQVNHIAPRNGQGYKRGCWHHLDNLETLCHRCHVGVTNAQRKERDAELQRLCERLRSASNREERLAIQAEAVAAGFLRGVLSA